MSKTKIKTSRLPRTLWSATAPDAPDTKPLGDNLSVDVAIIGAGFNGLRAGLVLAEAGKRVAIVDAGEIGWGASGRNGGQVNPIGHEPPAAIARRWQKLHDSHYADSFVQCVINSADEVFDLIRQYNISCDAEQNGWIRAMHANAAKKSFMEMYNGWSDAGASLRLIDSDELGELSGSVSYKTGWVADKGGSVQPLAYARGLAQAAINAGAGIYTQTRVERLSQRADQWVLQTPAATVQADQVILATNAYTDKLCEGLEKSIVPIVSVQAATEPLDDETQNKILPQRHTFADTRRVIYYFKKTADQRLVFGSAGFAGEDTGDNDLRRIRNGLGTVYPEMAGIKIDYIWGGQIAITQDHLPHIHQPAPGLWAGLGCNGRGVAMASVMGRLLAELALGSNAKDCPLPVTDIRAYPLHPFHKVGSTVILHWSEFLDRWESRSGT